MLNDLETSVIKSPDACTTSFPPPHGSLLDNRTENMKAITVTMTATARGFSLHPCFKRDETPRSGSRNATAANGVGSFYRQHAEMLSDKPLTLGRLSMRTIS